jgi:hypothetical protein
MGMNLYKAIQYLYAQKEDLERVIASLEELQRSGAPGAAVAPSAAKRRGRRSMSSAEREEVSKRMKKYWASRRKHKNTAGSI